MFADVNEISHFFKFSNFFKELKKQLQYDIGLDERLLLLKDIGSCLGETSRDRDFLDFPFIMESLYLQNESDRYQFCQILFQELEKCFPDWVNAVPKDSQETNSSKTEQTDLGGSKPNYVLEDDFLDEEEETEIEYKTETSETQLNRKKIKLDAKLSRREELDLEKKEKASVLKYHFSLSNAHLPLSLREMEQTWRILRYQKEEYQQTNQLDLDKTIYELVKNRFLDDFIWEKEKVNSKGKITVLIDHSLGMIAFWDLAQKIIDTARGKGNHKNISIYFFKENPYLYLYKNKNFTSEKKIDQVFADIAKKSGIVLIISDGGAAKADNNRKRLKETTNFLENLTKKGKPESIAWLNPMPEDRWGESIARDISKKVPMFPLLGRARTGFLQTISTLMGKETNRTHL